MFSLSGKIACVTGAGSGIGAAIAEVFAKAGAHVVVTDINEAAGKQSVESIGKDGGKAEFLTLDVSSAESAERLAGEVQRGMGGWIFS